MSIEEKKEIAANFKKDYDASTKGKDDRATLESKLSDVDKQIEQYEQKIEQVDNDLKLLDGSAIGVTNAMEHTRKTHASDQTTMKHAAITGTSDGAFNDSKAEALGDEAENVARVQGMQEAFNASSKAATAGYASEKTAGIFLEGGESAIKQLEDITNGAIKICSKG